MRYVTVNSVEQQDIQSMHRIRSLLMRDRIAQINQIRGLLAEYGVVIAQTPLKVRQQLPAILDDQDNELTELTRSMMRDMYERLTLLDTQIERYDELIRQAHKASVLSQRLEKIRGVGPMIATAVIAAAGSATEFANGRQFAAWLGLTPRQHSSGGQAAPVWDHEAGQRVSSDASGTRRKISRSAGSETQRWTFAMDSRGAGETGNERRRRGACEQDSPHDLGVAGPREGIRTASMTRA